MKKNLIVIGSVTYALKAKNLLFENGIKSYMERNKETKQFSCGYSLFIPLNTEKAIKILNQNNIKILEILTRKEGF